MENKVRSVKQLFDLSGKTALITGGSRGLGLQMAEALGEQGAKVIVSSRKQSDLDEAVAHLKNLGIDASAIAADLGKDSAITPLVDEALARLGHIDILINNAGATWGAPAEDHPIEAWDKVMNLNIRSIFLMSQAVGKRSMIPRKFGRIVNISSVNATKGAFGQTNYAAAKAGILGFTKSLALEVAKKGVTVNAVSPGFIDTEMTAAVREDLRQQTLSLIPAGRAGTPDDVANAVLFLVSDGASYVTGTNMAVNGGVHVYQ